MGHTVVVGVCGGIAAYKAATLCSLLVKAGCEVHVLMTENATRFISDTTFQALTKNPVRTDTFMEPNPQEISHIAVADSADVMVIAPATANIIAKLAHGLADDMVSTTALAVTAPLLVVPAMNVHMYQHAAVQANLDLLRTRGVMVLDPNSGPLACGYHGQGRLPEPEEIVVAVQQLLSAGARLAGVHVLVTAGPTVEELDPVRFLSNASTGKMGYEIARAAVAQGAAVTLVSGPTNLAAVSGATMVQVKSTEDMLRAVQERVASADVFIAAAAPADFRPAKRLDYKWKKSMGVPEVALEPTPDVLAAVGRQRRPDQVLVGFAAETGAGLDNARGKLLQKNLDMVVFNDVTEAGAGFAVDTNRVTFLDAEGGTHPLPLMSKAEVAVQLLDRVYSRFHRDRSAQG